MQNKGESQVEMKAEGDKKDTEKDGKAQSATDTTEMRTETPSRTEKQIQVRALRNRMKRVPLCLFLLK